MNINSSDDFFSHFGIIVDRLRLLIILLTAFVQALVEVVVLKSRGLQKFHAAMQEQKDHESNRPKILLNFHLYKMGLHGIAQ